jgi:hypothetical protein
MLTLGLISSTLAFGGLFQLIVLVAVLGVVWWLFTTYVPLPPPAKTIITVIIVLVLIFILLRFVGMV